MDSNDLLLMIQFSNFTIALIVLIMTIIRESKLNKKHCIISSDGLYTQKEVK